MNEGKTRAMSIDIVTKRTKDARVAPAPLPHIMPPRRGKSSRAATAAVATADDAMDVDAPTTSARAGSAGDVALELAAARNALRDAIDRANALGHWNIPPESACARERAKRVRAVRSRSRARTTDGERPRTGELKLTDLLDYARRISYTTFAPSAYVPGAPLCGMMPPAPQEEHFQVSKLAQHAADRKARAKAEAKAAEERAREEARRKMLEAAAAIPPEELIARLSKWKPGEPWPEGIPPPPPGWKPGDALRFDIPKMDEGVGAMVKPTNAVAAVKPAQRVVPFVSLDLNPDLDDDHDARSISDDFEEVSASEDDDDSD